MKFSIRFGNAKRGRVVRNLTVLEYLRFIGLDPIMVRPNGGICGKGGIYVCESPGPRRYVGGKLIEFGLKIY